MDPGVFHRVQARILRGITAVGSTPNAVMRAMPKHPSLELCIKEEVTKTAYRVSCVRSWKPSGGMWRFLLDGTLKKLLNEPHDSVKALDAAGGRYKIHIPRSEE